MDFVGISASWRSGSSDGKHQWVFVDGHVCTPRLENKGFHRIMDSCYADLVFLLNMGKMYYGAALVNLNDNIIGMYMGISADDYNVLASDKMVKAVEVKEKQLMDEFDVLKGVEKDLTILEQKREDADFNIKNATVSSADWEYGRQDTKSLTVLRSQIKYAIHVEYIKKEFKKILTKALKICLCMVLLCRLLNCLEVTSLLQLCNLFCAFECNGPYKYSLSIFLLAVMIT